MNPGEIPGLAEKIRGLLEDESFGERIRGIREKTIANFGRSGEVGGRYILDEIRCQVQARKQ